jgi:hypothetical protein
MADYLIFYSFLLINLLEIDGFYLISIEKIDNLFNFYLEFSSFWTKKEYILYTHFLKLILHDWI